MVTIKKKGTEKTYFSTEYLTISNIEWTNDAGNVVEGLPTDITYGEGNLIQLPENFNDLDEDEQIEALRVGITENLERIYGFNVDDFEFKAFNAEKVVNDDEDDEEDDDEPENIIDALIDMVSGFDSMTVNDKEYVIIPKEQIVKAICGITD